MILNSLISIFTPALVEKRGREGKGGKGRKRERDGGAAAAAVVYGSPLRLSVELRELPFMTSSAPEGGPKKANESTD